MAKSGRSDQAPKIDGAGPDSKVLKIAQRVAATIGTDFFGAITRHLAEALTSDCVLCGEFTGQLQRVRSLAACLDGKPATFDYELAESASASVAVGKPSLWRSDVQSRFPSDELLRTVGAQACVGVPLVNPKAGPIGILMALYRRPVVSVQTPKYLLEIFAERAAAELIRKQEDEKLRRSEERYKAFVARNIDGMWRLEFEPPIPTDLPEDEQVDLICRTGYLAECNDALARMLGLEKAEQILGSHLEDISPWSKQAVREVLRSAIRTGYAFTRVEVTKTDTQGKRRNILRSQWGIVEDGKLERIWGTSRDITEFKNIQMALDASEQRMADLLEGIHLAVVMLDAEGRIEFCNQYLYDATGWTREDVLHKDWIDLMIPAGERERIRAVFAASPTESDAPTHFECTIAGRAGQRRQFSWDSTILRDSEKKFTARTNIGRDVTEYKSLETQLRQEQKLSSIGRLAGSVAHDFNNLLTVIMGYSGTLLEKRDPEDPAYIGLTEIRKAAERGAELTHRLLAFSRRQVLQPQILNLNTLILDTGDMLRRLLGDDIFLATDLDPSTGLVHVDGGHFHQVLVNLAVNARDAMPRGGTLKVTTSNVEADGEDLTPAGLPPGKYVQLVVADTGHGMTEEVRNQAFEPFFTTKEKGTGLGLSTVYGIIQQSGGQITIESELEKGTSFKIFLPRVPMDIAQPRGPGVEAAVPGGTETVLLVEDQEEVRKLAARILSDLGYQVLEAETSARALELAQVPGHTIHLLLTDVMMPNLPGSELADLARAHQTQMKVLFMSGYIGACGVAERLSHPEFGYLQKPFTPEALGIKVREILDAR